MRLYVLLSAASLVSLVSHNNIVSPSWDIAVDMVYQLSYERKRDVMSLTGKFLTKKNRK